MWPFKSAQTQERQEPLVGDLVPDQPKNLVTASSGDVEAMLDLFGVSPSASGIYVTAETAMKHSAVYACVRLIAGAIGSLPLPIYQKRGDAREQVNNELSWMLARQPHPTMSAMTWKECIAQDILLHGDHFSEIVRPGRYSSGVASLKRIYPKRVYVEEKSGRLHYTIANPDGSSYGLDQDDILHIPGVGFDGKRGMSSIEYAGQNSIGGAIAADEYYARFFANDAAPGGVIKVPKKMSEEQKNELRNYWERRHSGLAKSHKPAVLTEGAEFEQVTMKMSDMQYVEGHTASVLDIARIFGVPPHMIGETKASTSWGTGIEQQSIGFVTYTLQPHLTRIQEEIDRKLLRYGNRYCEFNTAGLLKGDNKSRFESYKSALGGNQLPGWITVNEIRAKENMPPVEGGDELYVPITGGVADEEPPTEPAAGEQGEGEGLPGGDE